MENNYAIIDSTDTVVNIVVWGGDTDTWSPAPDIAVLIPEGATGATGVGVGWKYDPQGPHLFVPPDPQDGSTYDLATNSWGLEKAEAVLNADPVKVVA